LPAGPKGSRRNGAAVFLDRDGTITQERDYIRHPDDLHLYKRSAEALRLLRKNGFSLVVVTNQSGVARKYLTLGTLHRIHDKMVSLLARHGVRLDAIYYCPHHPEERCPARKPRPGMPHRAASTLKLDLTHSYVVGDMKTDMDLAREIGAKGVLVRTGHSWKGKDSFPVERRSRDLYSAARWIVRDFQKSQGDRT